MPTHKRPNSPRFLILSACCAAALAGCASVGPDYVAPVETAVIDDWQAVASSSPALVAEVATSAAVLPTDWWTAFSDPTLDALQQRVIVASPDLRTAALNFAQSRLNTQVIGSQRGPQVSASAQLTGQRQSENSAETRIAEAVGGANRKALVDVLAEPFSLYQAGFDVSWELDLWGRVRRSLESANASEQAAAAALADTRLVVASELARNYFLLRATQRQARILARQIALATDVLDLRTALERGGLADHYAVSREAGQLATAKAQLAPLQAREAGLINQIGLLTQDMPGTLARALELRSEELEGPAFELPALALGIPAEVARRRPDIRMAEAQLHAATADIGIAVSDLYPRVGLGASLGVQSIDRQRFGDWSSRTWQLGPVLSIPLFDQGRRRATVQLRNLQQQAAAIKFQQTVLKAWQEVDDALIAQGAETRQNRELRGSVAASRTTWDMAQAAYRNGLTSEIPALTAEQEYLQALDALTQSDSRLKIGVVTIAKSIGGGDSGR